MIHVGSHQSLINPNDFIIVCNRPLKVDFIIINFVFIRITIKIASSVNTKSANISRKFSLLFNNQKMHIRLVSSQLFVRSSFLG